MQVSTVSTVLSTTLLLATPALAAPGLTLARGAVNATLTVESEASAGRFGATTSVAPDLAVGVTETLTLALVHSSYARTGSRAGFGNGVCTVDRCAHAYDNAGVEALYGLRTGPLSVAVDGGLYATSFDREDVAGKLGAKLRYKLDHWAVQLLPSVALALSNRTADVPNRDRVFLPLSATYATPVGLSLAVAVAAKAPLDQVGDGYEGGAGVAATYAASSSIGVGASWSFGRLFGGDRAMDNPHGLDVRTMQVWLSVTE